jgi:CRP/FNR family transcriptional regulator, cyclic AMP receptor protein
MEQLDLDFLKKISLFHGLTQDKLIELVQIIHTESYEMGQSLIVEGDKSDTAFILLKGDVSITKRITYLPDDDASNPKNKVLINLSASHHAFFGEMAFFDKHSERSATVTARANCEVGVIKTDEFLELVSTDFELGYIIFRNISRTMSDRLKKANKDIIKLTTALTLALIE